MGVTKIPERLCCLHLTRGESHYVVPFPGNILRISEEDLPKVIADQIKKDGVCITYHPDLPRLGTLTVVKFPQKGRVELVFFMRVVIKDKENAGEMGSVAAFEPFPDEELTKKEFASKPFQSLWTDFLLTFGILSDVLLEKKGEKNKTNSSKLFSSINHPEKLMRFLSITAFQLNLRPEHYLLTEGMLGIFIENNPMRKLERMHLVFKWMLDHERDEDLPKGSAPSGGAMVEMPQLTSGTGSDSDKDLPPHVKKIIESEEARLQSIPDGSAEGGVIATYVSRLRSFPWTKFTEDKQDLKEVRRILDEDHYGLAKAKDSISEHLAVHQLTPTSKGLILCIAGPPGTGKTSLGKSIARALGRNFIRRSLGGVRDEAEIRGHRRTYIGAMPGIIVKGITDAGTINPVFLLDEVDKLGKDTFHGSPEDALLEVFDPEQNSEFTDHYMEIPIDLSNVLFIATANNIHAIHPALRDRMKIIQLHGYSEEEKVAIAERYVIAEELRECGLVSENNNVRLGVEVPRATIQQLVRGYTNEPGVRELKRKFHEIFSNMAHELQEGTLSKLEEGLLLVLTEERLHHYLGNPSHDEETRDLPKLKPGVIPMLAVMGNGAGSVGFIEISSRPNDRFDRTISGILPENKNSMEESVKVAMSRIWHSGILPEEVTQKIAKLFFHIHFDEGGIPKDGPSAGVAIYLGMASLLLNRPVKPLFAGTGEISLKRDIVLPIGGVREKLLAAERYGIRELFIPLGNMPDLEDLPPEFKKRVRLVQYKNGISGAISEPETNARDTVTVYCIETPEQALQLAFPNVSFSGK